MPNGVTIFLTVLTNAAIDKARSVNFCFTKKPTCVIEMFIDGHQLWALIDTSADLSLISNELLSLFKDKISFCNIMLKRISNVTIASRMITGFTKVSDDVLIGRNIFEDQSSLSKIHVWYVVNCLG